MRASGNDRISPFFWSALWMIALAIRIWGVWYFPTAEQDGYSDAETVARFSADIAAGTFSFSHLYGFWLPLFQLVAAIPNIWLHNPLLAGKVVSGLCGAVACVLAFAVSLRLAHSVSLACLAYVVVLLSPIHLLYSSACMTDVPFGCLLLASLLFVLRNQWTAAMIVAAVAGAVRVEAWSLIPLLPLLQLIKEKRVSVIGVMVLVAPPLLWLVVSQSARDDWFAFFKDRVAYQKHYMDFYPSRRAFAVADVKSDVDLLMFGATRIVFVTGLLAGLFVLFKTGWRRKDFWGAFVTVSYFAVVLAFLVLGYVTKRQPVWLPRYGLFALVLGAPLLAWLLRQLLDSSWPRWIGIAGVSIVIFLCASEACIQLSIIPKVLGDFRAHARIAQTLKQSMQQTNESDARCFSDDVSVRVLSGLPMARIVQSYDAPPQAWDNAATFDAFLEQKNVRYLVYMATEDSLSAKWLPKAGNSAAIRTGRFERIAFEKSDFGPDVALFRVTHPSP
jgi:hypothetical protein